ncbi:MAG TPA: RNA polymerase sigma factor [Chloroflexota bacterium]|nr:RNA polymerase sigma factor [Chloroflexota bacterium]
MIIEQIQNHSDGQLARAARTDAQAFDLLYRRHVTAVYRYCFAQTNCPTEAEDLTAQIFLAAWAALPRYNGRGSFAAWLFGIARRKCADFHRGRYRKPEEALDTAVALPDPAIPSLEQQVYRQGVWDCIQQALGSCSPDRREAIYLRFWGGLSVAETAAAMHKSEAAVKMLVSRAIAELKERCLSHE